MPRRTHAPGNDHDATPRSASSLHGPAAAAFRSSLRALGDLGFGLRDYTAHLHRILDRHRLATDDLRALCLQDLFLALGCLRGNELAYRTLIRTHEAEVIGHARRAGVGEDEAREEWQALLVRLVDRDGTSPLLGYAGRGRLAAFLRVSHLRSLLRRRRRHSDAEPAAEAVTPSTAARCEERERTAIVTDVVQSALAELPPAERQLLLGHHCDGRPLTALAVDLGLLAPTTPHLRTVASRLYQRSLQRFRTAVFQRARTAHNLDGREIEELLRSTETKPLHDGRRGLRSTEESS